MWNKYPEVKPYPDNSIVLKSFLVLTTNNTIDIWRYERFHGAEIFVCSACGIDLKQYVKAWQELPKVDYEI